MKSITKKSIDTLDVPCLMKCNNGGAVALFTSHNGKYYKGVIVGHPESTDSIHVLGQELTNCNPIYWTPFTGQIRLSND